MKKLIIVGLLIIIVAACMLLHWQHVKTSELDTAFLKYLPGTWMREENNLPRGVGMPLSMRRTNIVAADGSFVELTWFSHTDRTNTYERTGTWIIKNGHLIETLKTSTNPTEKTPWTDTGRIVRSDAGKFTVHWKLDETWQKIVQ
ncbi:MAG TPA: hypothetical protein VIK59_03370 [Verrucomicrobiae bacterium]